ncbi:hypothetical protein JCM24511_04579 [Saitozyma sp. JCM 24511]|nr:hypothetical protein JCM24511_04579 [Saitozyma sp. JCM 24511]
MSEEDRLIPSRASELSTRAEVLKNKYGQLLRDLQRHTQDTSEFAELRALLSALSEVESRASHSAAQVKSDELQESFELCTLEILAEIPDTFGADETGGDLKSRVEGFLSEYKTLMEEKQEADKAAKEVEQ